ncbi:hypothetical protein CIG75_17825 [Tumebacillus algifaecis]|uniref:Uncharacterized protein n=1 Tax=Tumebacillus algifaecis TaxID=1214604 RepID=A0A223D5K5_9BACL|nr:hypothetical protein [Tumebacillus algifaecis]ASS76644.1 hypothetical protein CIG75_17825 [Tumebacillus algifaecis]
MGDRRALNSSQVWLSMLVGLLLITGCSPEENLTVDPPITQTVTITDLPASTSILEETGWNQEAVRTFTNILPDNRAWIPLSIDMTGTFIGSVPGQLGKLPEMILLDSKTGDYEFIATLSSKDAQCAGADINENYVVWSEALDQTFVNWNMHIYDRKTQSDRIVYKSNRDKEGMGFPGLYWLPDLERSDFVFSPSFGPMTERGHNVKVLKVSAESGKVTEIAAPAGNPRVKKDYTMWVGRDPQSGDPELFWNREGHNQQLTKGEKPAYFDSDGVASYAWSNFQDDLWHVRLVDHGKQREIFSGVNRMDSLQWITMSEKFVTWVSTTKAQVYDRTREKVITLDDRPPQTIFSNNRYLFWSVQIENLHLETKVGLGKMFLVDLSKI